MVCKPIVTHSTGKGGKRADLGIYVRSSWEANYARYLNWLQARGEIDRWEYEPDTFEFPVKRGNRYYTPDFKVWEKGKHRYVEVKGWMDDRSRIKLGRMAKHYPSESVEIVDGKVMTSIARTVGPMIANWESNKSDKIYARTAFKKNGHRG